MKLEEFIEEVGKHKWWETIKYITYDVYGNSREHTKIAFEILFINLSKRVLYEIV